MALPFEDNASYLAAELGWIETLMHGRVLESRQHLAPAPPDILKGVCISDAQVDRLLSGRPDAPDAGVDALRAAAAAREVELAAREQASLEAGTYLALPHLAHLFGLSRFEQHVVLICLAPELDRKFETLYAYVQDDVTAKRPTIDLVLSMLCPSIAERLQGRAVLSPQSALFRARILRASDDPHHTLLASALKLDDQVVNFLCGLGAVDQELTSWSRVVRSSRDLASLRWPQSFTAPLLAAVRQRLQHPDPSKRRIVIHLNGPRGTGKGTFAGALCRELAVPLLRVELGGLLQRTTTFDDALARAFRAGVLHPAAVFLESFDQLLKDEDRALWQQQTVARCVDELGWLTFLSTERAWTPAGLFKEHFFASIDLPAPDWAARRQLWDIYASQHGPLAADVDCDDVSTKFRLTPGQMLDALCAARHRATLRDGDGGAVTMEDLSRACRDQSNQRLAALACKVAPHHAWSDITLPHHTVAQLREICAQMKHRQTVHGRWGFDAKLSLGKGLCVLFHGPSGTGKTMAVDVIANELQIDAYKIDLSTVVSKYIGETEKNLGKIFHEAETSNAILFFDEADALFGKRSEVKDAHDRYANIELNYLLQRMEAFEGLVILATNLRRNIDEAFFRRMHFVVEFPSPDEALRYRIWRQHFPASAPLAEDIDFDFLASRFNIAGGHIKNIVVNAAFLAAGGSQAIGMEHLLRATKREYDKIGRLCPEADCAPYENLLQER